MSTGTRYDAMVVGLGPVGALTALLLAKSGLRVGVLERSTEPVELPRAVGLDGESLRAFQRIGLGDEVHAILQSPREGEEVCFTDSKRQRLFGLSFPGFGHNGWRDMSFFDQPELESLLRRQLGEDERIDIRLGEEVVALAQDADGVELRSRGSRAERSWGADWVIGCDGASSGVRRLLDVEWQSLGYDQDWLVIDVVIGSKADLPLATMQVCDPDRLTTYVCVKDPNRRWEFQLLPGETSEEMLRPECIEALLRPWLPPEHYRIRRSAVYQFHAATAARWQKGRVFLAGDAAHQTPPFLGQGLNAGFRDAVNLGWKLPLVAGGACHPSLLATYAAERDAHARDLVEWAVAVGKLMETLAARERGEPDPHPRVDASAGYGQGRSAPPLRGGVLVAAQCDAASPVGQLLRQPRVRGADGRSLRLDELLGPGFALVARRPRDLALGDEAAAVLRRIGARSLALEGLELVEGSHDSLFERHAAAVVRPDRYVFGVAERDWSLDRLLIELGRRLVLAA